MNHETSKPFSPIGWIVAGAMALVAVANYVVLRQLFAREQERSDATLMREQERSDRNEKRIDDLANYYNTAVIPALERSSASSSETIELLAVMREQARIEGEIDRRDRLKRKEEPRLTLDELLAQLKDNYGLDVRALQEAAVASNRGGDEDWSKHFHGVCSRCTCHSKPCHCGCECCTASPGSSGDCTGTES